MAIRWDPLLCAAMAAELSDLVSGDPVRALYLDRDRRFMALYLRERTIAAELDTGWMSVTDPTDPPTEAHRIRHRVHSVTCPFDESLITIGLRPERRRETPLLVRIELIGTRRNVVVHSEPDSVIRHVLSPREVRGRALLVGRPYVLPTPTERSGPDYVRNHAAWKALVGRDDGGGDSVRARVLRAAAYTSSLNVDPLLGTDGWERWTRMLDRSEWGGYLLLRSGRPQPYPVAIGDVLVPPSASPGQGAAGAHAPDGGALPRDGCVGPFPDLLNAFHVARSASEAPTLAAALDPAGPLSRAMQATERAQRTLDAVERELARAPDPAPLRRTGDLILARLHEVPRGVRQASIEGFDGAPVEVRLDPTLAPNENADAYYRRASRAERARAALPERIARARAEVDRLQGLVDEHGAGQISTAELDAALGPGDASRRKTDRARETTASLPYRSLLSSGGLEIRIGRGARHNDDLTFRHSAPDDIWLHALQTPGAHVILRWGRKERPPRKDLTEAASLAALHSGARHSGSVAVGWTRRKYVRKARGSAPGAVSPDRVETVFVSPDPDLLDRLAQGPEGGS